MAMTYKIFNDISIFIDEQDVPKIEAILSPGCSWYFSKKNKQIKGWCIHKGEKVKLILSRVIMDAIDSDLDVDHINRNRRDNRRENLRLCTHQENCFNVGGNGADFYRGRWRAKIRTKEGRKYLGSFKTEAEAVEVYRLAVKQYHGEFAAI